MRVQTMGARKRRELSLNNRAVRQRRENRRLLLKLDRSRFVHRTPDGRMLRRRTGKNKKRLRVTRTVRSSSRRPGVSRRLVRTRARPSRHRREKHVNRSSSERKGKKNLRRKISLSERTRTTRTKTNRRRDFVEVVT
jgi:hypothetical protein